VARPDFSYGLRIQFFLLHISEDFLECSQLQKTGSSLGPDDFLKKAVRSEIIKTALSIF